MVAEWTLQQSCQDQNLNQQIASYLMVMEMVEDRRSLVGYSPWGHEESDTTEQLNNNNVILDSLLC